MAAESDDELIVASPEMHREPSSGERTTSDVSARKRLIDDIWSSVCQEWYCTIIDVGDIRIRCYLHFAFVADERARDA